MFDVENMKTVATPKTFDSMFDIKAQLRSLKHGKPFGKTPSIKPVVHSSRSKIYTPRILFTDPGYHGKSVVIPLSDENENSRTLTGASWELMVTRLPKYKLVRSAITILYNGHPPNHVVIDDLYSINKDSEGALLFPEETSKNRFRRQSLI